MSVAICDYIAVTFVAGAPLGFSVRARVAADPVIGETIVSAVVMEGQANRGGVCELDCVVAVNWEYTGFLSHEACLARLQGQTRPMVVVFARPVPATWNRVAKDADGEIKSGLLEKDMVVAHVFSKGFQARQFTLTKQTLSYSTNDVLRRKMALEDVLRVVPSLQQASTDKDRVFVVVTRDKDFELRAGSAVDRISWLHMIECAKNRAFDRPIGSDGMGNGRLSTSSSSSASMQPPPNLPPRPPNAQRNLPPPAIRLDSTADRGLYWMLQRSQVRIAGASTPDLSLPPLPPNMLESVPIYGFSLEAKVLGISQ